MRLFLTLLIVVSFAVFAVGRFVDSLFSQASTTLVCESNITPSRCWRQ